MTPEERELVRDLFERLAKLENMPRDPEAEQLIRSGLAKAPNALYSLVQSVLVQDEALKRADARIRELEEELELQPGEPVKQAGFLDSMRDALLGKPQVYDPVPWFWSDQYELKLQMAGLSDGYDDAKTVGDVAAARFSVEYRRNGQLIAVDAVNDGRAYMSGRKRIAEETA